MSARWLVWRLDLNGSAYSPAQAVVSGTVSQVDLLDVATGGEVLHALNHLDDAGAALADATTVIEVVQTAVGIDACIHGRLAKVGPFNASDLLAFLFKTDGGHGRAGIFGADKPTWPQTFFDVVCCG